MYRIISSFEDLDLFVSSVEHISEYSRDRILRDINRHSQDGTATHRGRPVTFAVRDRYERAIERAHEIDRERGRHSGVVAPQRYVIEETEENREVVGIGFMEQPVFQRAINDNKRIINNIYVGRNGKTHKIITNGLWTYPVLAEVIPSVKTNGEFSANIIICKKRIAKKLVYSKFYKPIEKFDSYILSGSNFHLVDFSNMISYLDTVMAEFYEKVGNNISIDTNELKASSDFLLNKLGFSKRHAYIVVYTIRNMIKNGKVFCWPVYSLIGDKDAIKLVYWHKNNKKFSKTSKLALRNDSPIDSAVDMSAAYAYNFRPRTSSHRTNRNADIHRAAVDSDCWNELTVERVADEGRPHRNTRRFGITNYENEPPWDEERPTREVQGYGREEVAEEVQVHGRQIRRNEETLIRGVIYDINENNREAVYTNGSMMAMPSPEEHIREQLERPTREMQYDEREEVIGQNAERLAREARDAGWGAIVERQYGEDQDIEGADGIDYGQDRDGPVDPNE